MLTLTLENLVRKYLGDRMTGALSDAKRSHAEAAARDEVAQALAEFCAAQPRQGADVPACAAAPGIR
jgi:hypothetical protein